MFSSFWSRQGSELTTKSMSMSISPSGTVNREVFFSKCPLILGVKSRVVVLLGDEAQSLMLDAKLLSSACSPWFRQFSGQPEQKTNKFRTIVHFQSDNFFTSKTIPKYTKSGNKRKINVGPCLCSYVMARWKYTRFLFGVPQKYYIFIVSRSCMIQQRPNPIKIKKISYLAMESQISLAILLWLSGRWLVSPNSYTHKSKD